MRRACVLAAATLRLVESRIKEGMSTLDVDRIAHEFMLDHGAYPATLNYPHSQTDPNAPRIDKGGFPRSVCTSINHVVCHGIPSKNEILKSGDIVNVDVTPMLDGYYGDTSRTFRIGEVSEEAAKVTEIARCSLDIGIEQVRAGVFTGDIGYAIHNYAEIQEKMGVVREYCGHGVGRVFHADPQIAHVARRGRGARMVAGMCFTIEPMINVGSWRTRQHPTDGWTVYTADGTLSAQFEHSICVTRDGAEIMTDYALIEGSEFDEI